MTHKHLLQGNMINNKSHKQQKPEKQDVTSIPGTPLPHPQSPTIALTLSPETLYFKDSHKLCQQQGSTLVDRCLTLEHI